MSYLVGDLKPKLLPDYDVPDTAHPLVQINLKIFLSLSRKIFQ